MKFKYIVKKFIGAVLPIKVKHYMRVFREVKAYSKLSAKEIFRQVVMILPKGKGGDDYARQLMEIASKMRIDYDAEYVYPYDVKTFRGISTGVSQLVSMTPDFDVVLRSSLSEIEKILDNMVCEEFKTIEKNTINGIRQLAKRISVEVGMHSSPRCKILSSYFIRFLDNSPENLDEAIQKLLFYHGLFWQMRHRHIGLGRLDMVLYPYYKDDISKGVLTIDEVKRKIKEMILIIGRDSRTKSDRMVGDTGQYILLGGINKEGENVENELTEMILDIFKEVHIPDPKLILRTNRNTTDKIWRKAVDSILTGNGSPLIMNEEAVMKNMVEFGYSANDVWNVGTSACWEPLIIGKSFDQNNPFRSASAPAALNHVLLNGIEYTDFDEFKAAYRDAYKQEILSIVRKHDFDVSPLLSLFYDDCLTRSKDFSKGGTIYANHGCQIVGLPNAVNGLLNINKYVFDTKILNMQQLREAITTNFTGHEDIKNLLEGGVQKFGKADYDVISLTNELMEFAGDVIDSIKYDGQRLKVGFSSPQYIIAGANLGATPDGRCAGQPLAVHISPVSSNIDFAEVLDFASRLKYTDNRINGNVVDFIVPQSYSKNPDALVSILKDACSRGVFELQLNVFNKETLIDAKLHPELHSDLIVRVWGYSAYFNDLPEEYKDNLIARCEAYGCN